MAERPTTSSHTATSCAMGCLVGLLIGVLGTVAVMMAGAAVWP